MKKTKHQLSIIPFALQTLFMRLSQTWQTKAAVPMELCKRKRKQNNKKQVLMLNIEVLFYKSLYVWDVYGMPCWRMINHPKFVCNVKVLSFIINCLLIYNQLSLLNVFEGTSCIICHLFMNNWITLLIFYGSRKFECLPLLLRFRDFIILFSRFKF